MKVPQQVVNLIRRYMVNLIRRGVVSLNRPGVVNLTGVCKYMLRVINNSLSGLLNYKGRILTDEDRLSYFMENGPMEFTRKDYMSLFKDISSATASRDLKKGIDQGLFDKVGSLNKTTYRRK